MLYDTKITFGEFADRLKKKIRNIMITKYEFLHRYMDIR